MTEKTFQVPEIHCDHCKMSLEGAVSAVPGVGSVSVDIPARTVHVHFDDASTGTEQIEAAIEAQGYAVQR